jgi:hypothetical protein
MTGILFIETLRTQRSADDVGVYEDLACNVQDKVARLCR